MSHATTAIVRKQHFDADHAVLHDSFYIIGPARERWAEAEADMLKLNLALAGNTIVEAERDAWKRYAEAILGWLDHWYDCRACNDDGTWKNCSAVCDTSGGRNAAGEARDAGKAVARFEVPHA